MILPKHVKDVMIEYRGFEVYCDSKYCDSKEGIAASAIYEFTSLFNQKINAQIEQGKIAKNVRLLDAGDFAMFLAIDMLYHHLFNLYIETHPSFIESTYSSIKKQLEAFDFSIEDVLITFLKCFPPNSLYTESVKDGAYNGRFCLDEYLEKNRYEVFKALVVFVLLEENPAILSCQASTLSHLCDESELTGNPAYLAFKKCAFSKASPQKMPQDSQGASDEASSHLCKREVEYFGKIAYYEELILFCSLPFKAAPYSLMEQLEYIKMHWQPLILKVWQHIVQLESIAQEAWRANVFSDEGKGEIALQSRMQCKSNGGTEVPQFFKQNEEYEAFSLDDEWMENTVLLAKNTYVYLDQLSKKYKKAILSLDDIPDEQFKDMQEAGITALWLIGLWQRSPSSKIIKRKCGNAQALASAYSIYDYKISDELGGEEALQKLKAKAARYGIRLSADMVPNHTAIDSVDVMENPHLFLQTKEVPFPSYNFETEDLSQVEDVSIYLEKHYYDRSDCAVVFKRVDNKTGDTCYIFHGNDGTSMPWNDTAQLDFLNEETREHVISKIIEIAQLFDIIRFDAAMVLTQRHIRRLWHPDFSRFEGVAGRAGKQMSDEEFYSKMPHEFWRCVVDRVREEVPSTLLMAEAFWMLEGYFVRTLGMHRVYNSAFMNMLKNEENEKYRQTVKNTLRFDRQVLKRYVNFMSNPDEQSAAVQFGKGDKYFGVCTMMVCLPGLPMFAHGQILGFAEKYGMEYSRAYIEEMEDDELMARHRLEIFPLLRMREVFSGVENFYFYDVLDKGVVREDVFCWSNMKGKSKALVCYNNTYACATGEVNLSVEYKGRDDGVRRTSLFEALCLSEGDEYYTIFYEIHSKLYYIRKNYELKDRGLVLMLRGFEAQVFLNFEEVKDEGGEYAILCEKLDGKGIENITVKRKTVLTKGGGVV